MTPIDTFELPPVPSLVTSLDWHETIKRFARDSIRKYLEESGFARHLSRSDAWGEVVAVLDEVAPGWWRECKSTGEACAVAAIRKLAADAARAAVLADRQQRGGDVIDDIFLVCARLGMAGASDEEVLRYARTAIAAQGEEHDNQD